jgi:signal transduction histidine kinase
MNPARATLQGKLQRSMVVVVLLVAVAALGAVSISSLLTARSTLTAIETRQTEALSERGKVLGETTAQALSSLAADNAFSDIDRLLARVVHDDSTVIFAVYLDANGTVWSYAGPGSRPGAPDANKQARWKALGVPVVGPGAGETRATIDGTTALVRQVTVRIEREVIGTLVLGLSTAGVQRAIAEARHSEMVSAATSLALMVVFILASATLALGLGRRLARTLSRPLSDLTLAASQVAEPTRQGGAFEAPVPVSESSDGEVGALAVAFNTMVDRIAARERALARNEAELQAILSSLPDTLVVLDESLRLLAVRSREGSSPMPGLGTRAGAELSEIVGARAARILEPAARAVLEEGRPSSHAVTLGVGVDALELETFATRFTTEGRTRVVLSLRDVTARRLLEQELRQSQKLDALGRLAGGVAHDLNNLLMVIQTALELMRDEESADRRAAIAADAGAASAQATRLVKDMLTFARKRRVELASVDLHGIIERIARMSERTFGRQIKVVVQLGAFDANVSGDVSQLESAILNLTVNARDAMPQGGTLTLRTTRLGQREARDAGAPAGADAGAWVRVDVADSGTGIAPDVLAHVFEPFFTTKEEGRGTGMGLAAVYGAAQAHQGTVLVDSALGKGTTFSLLLPLAEAPRAQLVTPAARPAGQGLRVLVVDDDAMVRGVVVRQVTLAGFRSVGAGGTAAEVEAFFAREGAGVDIALLDVNMPDCSGPELARRLRLRDPDLPVAFMSGVDPMAPETAAMGDAFLAKPFSVDQLKEALRAAVESARGVQRRDRRASSIA